MAGAGYVLALFGGRFTGTPNLGLGLADGGARDWRIGRHHTSAIPGGPGFELDLDATRRGAVGGSEAEHGLILRGAVRWCGPGGTPSAGRRASRCQPPRSAVERTYWSRRLRPSSVRVQLRSTTPACTTPTGPWAVATVIATGRRHKASIQRSRRVLFGVEY